MLTKSKFDRLILISSPDISRGVYESHVISFIENMKNKYDLKFALISFGKEILNSTETLVFNERMNKIKDMVGEGNLLILKSRSTFNVNSQKKLVKSFIDSYNNEKLILFCQNYYTGFIGTLLKKEMKNLHLHVDFKGIVPEEHLMYGESNGLMNFIAYGGAKMFEKSIFRHADSFSVVSHSFKTHFEKKYQIGSRPFIVLPSSIDNGKFFYDANLRTKYRELLCYENEDLVITYAGSLQKWQEPETIFNFFEKTAGVEHCKFLLLTFDKDKAKNLLEKYVLPLEKIKIISVSPLEVNGYLNASDICLLLRKNDIVNNVASPTKFSEYFCTKNKIIISEGVGDFSALIANSNHGICLKSESFDPQTVLKEIISKNIPEDSIISAFEKEYSIEHNIEKLSVILS